MAARVGVLRGRSADSFDSTTLEFPGLNDWVSARYRVLTRDVGLGVEKEIHFGKGRLSMGGGASRGQAEGRVTAYDWAKVTTYPSKGTWLSAAVSRELGSMLDLGARATYSWTKYHMPYDWESKGGGLQLGLALGANFGR